MTYIHSKIKQVFNTANGELSIQDVARLSETAWVTAKKYIELLVEDGMLEELPSNNYRRLFKKTEAWNK